MASATRLTQKVIRLLETTDLKQAEIAEQLGTSFQNVSRIKKEHSVTRPKDRKRQKQRQDIEGFLEESDMGIMQIAKQVGASRYLVRDVKAALDVEPGAGNGGAKQLCISCLRERHPRLFDDSDTCSECRKVFPATSELVLKLDRLSRRLKVAGQSIVDERHKRARDFYIQ